MEVTKDTQQYHGNPLGGYNVYPAERNNHGEHYTSEYQEKSCDGNGINRYTYGGSMTHENVSM